MVRAGLETLSAAQREVLVLCDLEGHTQAEVAVLIGVPLGTVKSRLLRARSRFRAVIERRSQPTLTPVPSMGEGS